jgi:hypothetical protein
MSTHSTPRLEWVHSLICVLAVCGVSFQGLELRAQDDKPLVVSLLDVSPNSIPVGSSDITLTLRFRANDPQVVLPLAPTEYQVEWGGLQKVTLPADKVNPPIVGVYSLEFTVSPGLATSPEAVNITLLVKLPGSGGRSVPSNSINFSVASPSLFVPIVLSASGMNNSFYISELTLTNRSSQDASLSLTYTAAFGGGSGTATDTLAAGRQRIVPDAITYLSSLGVPIQPTGNRGGTLRIEFTGPGSASEVAATVRTMTVVEGGSAGLAYSGIGVSATLAGRAYLCGLRQNATDRSNVALQHVGAAGSGDIVLRLTVFSGDPAAPLQQALPDVTLTPGGFHQENQILIENGLSLSNGFVQVDRVSGTAPYYAYAIINDQANSDGSFVPAVLESSLAGRLGATLPVIVEANVFSSELVVTNFSTVMKNLSCRYSAEAIQNPERMVQFQLPLRAGEQVILADLVQHLRDLGVAGIPPQGSAVAGPLFVTVDSGDLDGVVVGARTSAPGGGGRYGVFYMSVPFGAASTTSAWIYGLQQDNNNRTNLGLVNTGESGSDSNVFTIELFDGNSGAKVATVPAVILEAGRWTQLGTILAQYAPGSTQGYAHIIRSTGSNPFISYGVVNDGGQPGLRTGDGAYISSSP